MYKCTMCGNINNFIQENIVLTKIQLSDNGKINNMRNIKTTCIKAYCDKCGKEVDFEKETGVKI